MEKDTGILEWSLLGWGQKAELQECRTEDFSLAEKSLGFCRTENHLLCPCSSVCDPVTLREDGFFIIVVPVFFHGAYFSFKKITASASISWRVLSPAGSGQKGVSHVRNHLEKLSFSTLVFTQGFIWSPATSTCNIRQHYLQAAPTVIIRQIFRLLPGDTAQYEASSSCGFISAPLYAQRGL